MEDDVGLVGNQFGGSAFVSQIARMNRDVNAFDLGSSAGTMSCSSSAVIVLPARLPSFTSRAVSLRPTMPAAPVIKMRKIMPCS
jgi:hypothetical protein